jgi:predicted pyridoxine 5'-phosphate oxidase superfamily flavin-nucleotide-binding protein
MERIVRGAGDSGAQERRVTQTPREPQISQAPWHEGERAAHARLGLSERMAEVGERALRNFMPDQHRLFFAQLPFLVVGSVDADQQPWASMLFGQPGFAMSPDPFTLDVAALPDADDPLAPAIVEGAALGLLGIELPTLRRNRMNGHVASTGPGGFSLSVDQSFGNCPQYIHRRDYEGFRRDAFARSARAERLTTLGAEELSLIARADTCFVASAAIPRGGRADGIDVSHRGGMPGFLKLDRRLSRQFLLQHARQSARQSAHRCHHRGFRQGRPAAAHRNCGGHLGRCGTRRSSGREAVVQDHAACCAMAARGLSAGDDASSDLVPGDGDAEHAELTILDPASLDPRSRGG